MANRVNNDYAIAEYFNINPMYLKSFSKSGQEYQDIPRISQGYSKRTLWTCGISSGG